jgi:hypothetical protein
MKLVSTVSQMSQPQVTSTKSQLTVHSPISHVHVPVSLLGGVAAAVGATVVTMF